MRLFLDTEFNGFNGELISIALVAEDGQYLYEVIEHDNNYQPWVAEHVVPFLGKHPITRGRLQDKLQIFLRQFVDGITITADWPEDIKHFCDLLIDVPGQMIDCPIFIAEMDRSLAPATVHSKQPHNALEDARALQLYYRQRESI